ncbi:MAG: putative Ig domain-containing protein, partial [Planctomycetota bacterium]
PALVSASTVHYAGLFPGATDEYVAAPDKMKHTQLLDSTALQLPAGTAWIGGVYELVLPVGHELQLADGTPVAGPMIVDGAMRVAVDGLPLYRIERVVISDSSMSPAGITDGRYSIVPLGDNCFRMTMEAPAAWCADPSRMLPIRIDPTLALEPDAAAGKDAPVWAGSAGTNYGTSQWTWAGFVGANSEINSLIQFDLTSIPTFAQVTSASFDWSNTAQANLDGINVDCHVITAAWVEATVNWNTRPAHNVNLFDTKVFSGGYGWETWTNMAATVQNWVSGAVVNNGFTFKAPNAGAVYAAGGTSDAAAGTWPKFTVDYNLGPVIQTPAAGALPDGYVSTAYTQAYTISGGVAPITWSIIAGSLPAGLNINPTTGTISGTPSTPGNSSFTVEVRDTNNLTDTHAQTINVYSALAITNPPAGALADGIQNIAYTPVTVTATGGKPSLVWSIVAGALPTGLSLNTGSGQISGTPTVANVFNFTVRVTDANAIFVQRAYTITVYDVPTITSPAPGALVPEGYVGRPYSRQINAAGGFMPYTWSIPSGALPAGLSINTSSGLISGTPSSAGNNSFSVRVTDSNAPPDNDTEAYTLQILIVPTINSPAAGPLPNATRNAPNYSQTFTGINGKTPYAWSASGLPSGMTLNAISGVLSGTPTASGLFNITVTLNDANLVNHQLNYQLTVNPAVLITTTSLPDAEEDSAYSQTPVVTGGTAPISWVLGITPSLPELTINASTGEISGTPLIGAQGTYQLSITATDSLGGTHNRSISIFITQPGGGTAANCACNSRNTARDSAFGGWLLACLPLLLLVARRRLT